ncbi:MAG: hypothetical protein MI799_23590 [Desulfobacterales bacterium]|nr:hypothetical protein [Desulfobacterales bacterium]
MAKLQKIVIDKTHIDDYINNTSDFTFEIKTLKELVTLGFECEHGGTYEDPITKKTREFDIRASKRLINLEEFKLDICLSVECKNIRNNHPLVIQSVKRLENESYMDLVWSNYTFHSLTYISTYGYNIPIYGDDSPYPVGGATGKSCDQVGMNNNNEIVANDSSVFDKISQSINAAYSLLKNAHYASDDKDHIFITLVLPILVVPDDRLWNVTYDVDGNIISEPSKIPNCEYYIDKSWLLGGERERKTRYNLSHLEIVQLGHLEQLIKKYTDLEILSDKNLLEEAFCEKAFD